jgi:hypothetical protein
MKKLRTLTELLKMATEARKVASEPAQVARLKTLIADMKRAAHDASARQRRSAQKQRDSYIPTRFELCVTGIRKELDFGRRPLSGIGGLEARLSRICDQIERTIKDANTPPQGLINE